MQPLSVSLSLSLSLSLLRQIFLSTLIPTILFFSVSYTYHICLMHATSHACLILLFLIIFLTFPKKQIMKLFNMKFSEALLFPLSSPHIVLSTALSNTQTSPPLPLSPIFNMYLYFYVFVVLLITYHIEGEKTGGTYEINCSK